MWYNRCLSLWWSVRRSICLFVYIHVISIRTTYSKSIETNYVYRHPSTRSHSATFKRWLKPFLPRRAFLLDLLNWIETEFFACRRPFEKPQLSLTRCWLSTKLTWCILLRFAQSHCYYIYTHMQTHKRAQTHTHTHTNKHASTHGRAYTVIFCKLTRLYRRKPE